MNQLLPKDLLVYARKFDEYEINKSIRSTVKSAKKHKRWLGKPETPNKIVLGTFSPTVSMSVYTNDFDAHPIRVVNGDTIQYSAPSGSHLNISMYQETLATIGRRMIIDGHPAIITRQSTSWDKGFRTATGTIEYRLIDES